MRDPVYARLIVTDLDGVVTTWLTRSLLGASFTSSLLQPATASVALRSNSPEVNRLFTDSDPLVAQSNRLLYILMNEGGNQPFDHCRYAGIIMSPQDQADADAPVTHLSAWDPWQYVMARPFYIDDSGTLPPQGGYRFFGVRGGVIVATALKNAILSESVGCFIDAGLTYGGTPHWTGVIEDTPELDLNVQQGMSVGDVWNAVIAAGDPSGGPGGCDIVLQPIYDPGSDIAPTRPGFLAQFSVYNVAGTERPSSPLAWGQFTRTSTTADRQHDGTPGAFVNEAYLFAGQGGAPAGLIDNPASIAKYRPYWAQQFFPSQPISSVVEALAHQIISLQKQGKRTFTVNPDPMRAAVPFRDYDIGDRIPQLVPSKLRVAATGYQRVQTIPVEINPDGVTRVNALLTCPDWRGNDGT